MESKTSKAKALSPQANAISVLAGSATPSRTNSITSPPTHYTGSTNYTDSEWREVQAWGHVKETHEIHKIYDEQGRKIINKYEIVKEIGRGVHGKVKLARTLDTNELVALKVLPRRKKARLGRPETNAHEQTVKREIAILKKCVHPHVVRLREVIDDPASEKIYLVLEYMWGGEVIWRTEDDEPALKLHQARSTFRDTMLGLEFCMSDLFHRPLPANHDTVHYQGVIHRDIKPANLLWTKNHSVKISDFGVSHTSELATSALELAKTAGTPAFFAPELCWTAETQDKPCITKAIDIWALGVTLFCLLCGRVPFEAHNEFELFDKITTEEVEIPPTLDDEATDLLRRMLIKDPADRITIPEIKHHPFVLKGVKHPEQWISDTNPGLFGQLEVDDQEVHEAVSSYETFKRRLSKITNKLAGGLRRRTISSEEKTPRTSRRPAAASESSSKSSSWMNFMRTSDSADGAASSTTSRGAGEKEYRSDRDRPFDTRIKSEDQIHPGARSIARRPSAHDMATDATRSRSPSFRKHPVGPLRDGTAPAIDVPAQSHLTRSIGFHQGLIVEEEDERPRLPSLSFESAESDGTPGTTSPTPPDDDDHDHGDDGEEDEEDDGLLIDFNKRRTFK
ncbi:protein of unknown function [Taphrina deformans PYCC 5710]|uniref:non-specific serine/threonine protein kinase n=1 Tax=Taphrina deformans (strain PYCC 5710 / ATCC 11124 / CBS 356.35 / IMI 108563 / JCM 9778 / NBRC 8474) TaxID=1097556 RepID=R4XKK6_TAPDE|nr:protein of unknown function [Taphrina deformans PYCC 5710]|eukprot:CCG84984.1 protein of unknown function [Taphrina deformans PYCC 5710]